MGLMMNFKDKLTDKEIEYLLSLVESDYEEVAQYVDSKELEKEDREQYIYYCEQYAMIDNLRKKLDFRDYDLSNRGAELPPTDNKNSKPFLLITAPFRFRSGVFRLCRLQKTFAYFFNTCIMVINCNQFRQ